MILQTQIPIPKEAYNPIIYSSKILLLGSCFSENIGNKFLYYKFQSLQNPFGILFQPKAIETLITNAVNNKEYSENDVFFINERWHCFDAHSSLSASGKKELLANLNQQLKATNQQIQNASHIIITLGTSWVYRFIETNTIVANCHKVPQKKFLKELLSVDEITESLKTIESTITLVNKNASIIYTVSPVRHLKDGFVQNQQSKSHLISAIHQRVAAKNNTYYFPSYEIMMDELREYRFYAEDMVHPNKIAIKYIWEKFADAWISESSYEPMKAVSTIQNGINHRPFNPNSEEHQQFLKKLADKIQQLQNQFPWMKF